MAGERAWRKLARLSHAGVYGVSIFVDSVSKKEPCREWRTQDRRSLMWTKDATYGNNSDNKTRG
jgi:hypothetical protein